MRVTQDIDITPQSVLLNGKPIEVSETGDKMLVELYRRYVKDYPKFFKMDTLSRLGFIAAELLLQDQTVDAVILANRSASIKNDTDYLETISNGNYYPSPALFVYTLPNIVTGEIAIRNKYYGESSFYVLDDEHQLEKIIALAFEQTQTQSVLTGWVECTDENTFEAHVRLLKKL